MMRYMVGSCVDEICGGSVLLSRPRFLETRSILRIVDVDQQRGGVLGGGSGAILFDEQYLAERGMIGRDRPIEPQRVLERRLRASPTLRSEEIQSAPVRGHGRRAVRLRAWRAD